MTTSASLTEKEIAVLKAIRDDEYRDGDLDQPVWSHGINLPAGMTRRGMGGVFASLSEKGYASLGGKGKDATVTLLAPAIDHLTATV